MALQADHRHVINTVVLLTIWAVAGIAQTAETVYPTRPVRLLLPFPPGGSTDATARIISPKLGEAMGQAWVVDNRSGASGNLATEIVARANPDGYTVLLALDNQLTANPILYKLSFSVEKDLQPITMIATGEYLLVANPGLQAKTFKEFVALAKQKPGALNYASGSVATQLATELLKKQTGIDIVHVPYKGGGLSATGVIAGETQVQLGTVASSIAFVASGRLRALATTGAKRSKMAPDVPTVAESGYSGFEAIQWMALLVQAMTPISIGQRIRSEAVKVLQQADVQAAMALQGVTPIISTPEELAARIKRETGIWAGIIKDAGIRAE